MQLAVKLLLLGRIIEKLMSKEILSEPFWASLFQSFPANFNIIEYRAFMEKISISHRAVTRSVLRCI